MTEFKTGDKVLVTSEGYEGEIITAFTDGSFHVRMDVVDDDGEDYDMICLMSDLEPVAPATPAADVARLQRQLALAVDALKPFAAFALAHNKTNGAQHMWETHPEFGIAYFEGATVTAGDFQTAADALDAIRKAGGE